MKTDSELRAEVLSELQWDTSIRGEDIAVSVQDQVVTLAGTVDLHIVHSVRHSASRISGT